MFPTHLNPNNFLFYITSNFTPIDVYPRLNGVAALTGFSYKIMYGHFAGKKQSSRYNELGDHINEVTERRDSTVNSEKRYFLIRVTLFICTILNFQSR